MNSDITPCEYIIVDRIPGNKLFLKSVNKPHKWLWVRTRKASGYKTLLIINRLKDGANVWYHISFGKWYLIISKKGLKVLKR